MRISNLIIWLVVGLFTLSISCKQRLPTNNDLSIELEDLIIVTEKLNFQNPDSSLKLLIQGMDKAIALKDKSLLQNMRSRMATAYSVLIDYTKSDSCLFEIISAADPDSDIEAIANAYINLGINQSKQLNIRQALEYYQKGEDIAYQTDKLEKIRIRTLNNIGLAYISLAKYDSAMYYLQDVLIAEDKIGNKLGVARASQNIGICYANQKNHNDAASYFQRATELYNQVDDMQGVINSEQNRAVMLTRMGKYDEAFVIYDKIEELAQQNNMQQLIASVYNNKGLLYYNMGDYEKSLEVSKKSIAIKESNRDTIGIMISLNSISALYDKLGSYKLSEEYALKALDLAERKENINLKKDILQNLIVSSIRNRNVTKSIDYLKERDTLIDSLFNKEKFEAMHELTIKYDVEKKENELQLANQTIKSHHQLFLFLTLLFILILISALIFHYYYRKQRKTELELLRRSEAAAQAKLKMISHYKAVKEITIVPDADNNENDIDTINNNGNGTTLSIGKIEEIIKEVNSQFKFHKVHLDSSLTLAAFAEIIGTNTTYLSTVLNQALNTNFTSLLNFYRIEEAKHILKLQANTSPAKVDNLDTIASNCGFRSVSAFHVNFKKETGMTPGQYKKSLIGDN